MTENVPNPLPNKNVIDLVQRQAVTVVHWEQCCADIMDVNHLDPLSIRVALVKRANNLVSHPLIAQLLLGIAIAVVSYYDGLQGLTMGRLALMYLIACAVSQTMFQLALSALQRRGHYVTQRGGLLMGTVGTCCRWLLCSGY